MTRDEVIALACQQGRRFPHRQRLVEYQSDRRAGSGDAPGVGPALVTLRMGILYETMSIEYSACHRAQSARRCAHE